MKELKILNYLIKLENNKYQVYEIAERQIYNYILESFESLHEAIEYVNTFIKYGWLDLYGKTKQII